MVDFPAPEFPTRRVSRPRIATAAACRKTTPRPGVIVSSVARHSMNERTSVNDAGPKGGRAGACPR